MSQELLPNQSTITDDLRPASDQTDLPLDQVYHILSNERRRMVLYYLLSVAAETTLSDLSETIASIENEKSVGSLSSTERKRVYICLYQCHLPKMDDSEVIDFDYDRKTVEKGRNLDDVVRFLPGVPEDRPRDRPAGWFGSLSKYL